MKHIILLINGVHFPANLFEDALAWAAEHQCAFHCLILTDHLIVDAILEDSVPAPASEQKKIAGMINIIEQRTKDQQLKFKHKIIVKPMIEQVIEEIRFAEKIFIGLQEDENFKNLSFKWNDILNLIPLRQQVISNRAYR